MSADYYVRPFRPKLSPDNMFVTATGIYLVTKDKALPSKNEELQPYGRKKGYVCVRMAGNESSKISAWSSTMWESDGNYRILEKDEGLVITQGKLPDWKGDCDFFRKLRNYGPKYGRKLLSVPEFEPDEPQRPAYIEFEDWVRRK